MGKVFNCSREPNACRTKRRSGVGVRGGKKKKEIKGVEREREREKRVEKRDRLKRKYGENGVLRQTWQSRPLLLYATMHARLSVNSVDRSVPPNVSRV